MKTVTLSARFLGGLALIWAGSVAITSTASAAPPQFVYVNNFAGKWGSTGSGDGQFTLPAGIARNSEGDVFVVETSNSRVQKFDAEGQFISKFGTFGAGDGQFFSPYGIAINATDEIYVVDSTGNRVQQFDADGVFIRAWGSAGSMDGQFQNPQSVAIAPGGNVYVADYGNDRIQVFQPDGTFVRKFGVSGSGDGELSFPDGIAVDGGGNVFVVDAGNDRVQVFNSSDAFVRKWGSTGAGDGEFDFPKGLALGADGIVYVTDFNNDRVQAFTTEGDFLGKWGTPGNGDGEFQGPSGVMVTAEGRVYVSNADMGIGNRVQYFEPIWNVMMDEDGDPTPFSLTLQAMDADMDTLTWSISGLAVNGAAGASGTGTSKAITYTPNPDYNGTDSFDVQIDDGNAGTATRSVVVTIAPINDGPVIDQTGPLSVTMSQDGTPDPFVAPTVTATDPEGDTITWSVSSAASNGTATVGGTGLFPTTFTYVPTAAFVGMDSFTVQASDGSLSDSIVVNVTIESSAVPPVIDQGDGPVPVEMEEDGLFTAPMLSATDMDTAPSALTWSVSTPATSGVATVSGNGASPSTFDYTPTPDFSGMDSFTVQVSDGMSTDTITILVTVTPTNDAPEIDEGSGPLTVTMSEDSDPTDFVAPALSAMDIDSGTLTWSLESPASQGTATVSGAGASPAELDYTPAANFNGSDSFTVQVSDGALSDTIVINVTVEPVNDGPVIDQGAGPLAAVMDEDGAFTAPELSATDIDTAATSLTWSLIAPASHGTATASGSGAAPTLFTYVPEADFYGSDSFTVQVSDGDLSDLIMINVAVNPVNDAPTIDQGDEPLAVTISEDSDPTAFVAPSLSATDKENDTLTWTIAADATHGAAVASGTGASPSVLTYTPNSDYNGTDSFTIQVSDGDLIDTIVVDVTVEPVNDAPVIAQGDDPLGVTMEEDGSFTAPALSATDIDTASETLVWTVLVPASDGVATVSGSGAEPTTFDYAPEENFHGSDSFTVQVSDGALSDTIVVDVTVNSVNDNPTIASSGASVTMDEDGNTPDFSALAITASDVDGPNGNFGWTITAQGTKGQAGISPTGASPAILYVPRTNLYGTDSFTLAVSDGDGGTAEITLSVTITPQPDAPIIVQGDMAMGTYSRQGTASGFSAPVLAAYDPDGDALNWSLVTQATHGTAEVSGDGASPTVVDYTPEEGYLGDDSFVVAVTDSTERMAAITVNVEVVERNDTPTIVQGEGPIVVTMDEDATFIAPALSATDDDGDPMTWSLAVEPTSGTATVSGMGTSPTTFTYTPEASFNGTDQFTIQVVDPFGATDTIEIVVNINAVDDAPVITQGDEALEVAMDEDSEPVAFVAPELSATDEDSDTSALTWSIAEHPLNGVATVSGVGPAPDAITYVPVANFNGDDAFTVAVSDGDSTDTIEIIISVSAQNDAPYLDALLGFQSVGEWDISVPEGVEALDRLPIAIGPENNVYVGDNTHIRVYSPDGEFIRDFAEVTAESFAVDALGAVYVAIKSPGSVVKFTSDGEIDPAWPVEPTLFSSFDSYTALSVSTALGGSLRIIEGLNYRYSFYTTLQLRGVTPEGGVDFTIGIENATNNFILARPRGSALNSEYVAATDAAGNSYVWDQEGDYEYDYNSYTQFFVRSEVVTVYNQQGQRLNSFSVPNIQDSVHRRMAVRPDGLRAYTSDDKRRRVDVRAINGTVEVSFDGTEGEGSRFETVSGLAANADGRIYVADQTSRKVRFFDEEALNGSVTVRMNEDGSFFFPYIPVDPDNDPITWTILSDPEHGTVVSGETLGYAPQPNYHGNDAFEVVLEDDNGLSSPPFIVNVIIDPVEDIPVIAQGDADILVAMTENGTPVSFSAPTLSATDADGDTLTWRADNKVAFSFYFFDYEEYLDPTQGTVFASGTGASPSTLTYTPPADYVGTDSFTMIVSDSKGNTDQIVIRVIISSASATSTLPVVAQLLENDFENTDVNEDGMLSRLEVVQRYPDITNEQYDEMDEDGDGFLSEEELQNVEEPPVPAGCNMEGDAKYFGDNLIGRMIQQLFENLSELLVF